MLEELNVRPDKEDYDTKGRAESRDELMDLFPGRLSDDLQAMLDLTESVMEIHGSPIPSLKWAYVNRKPRIRKATRRKEQFIAQQVQDAVTRKKQATAGDTSWVMSATDQVVLGERTLADRDGRAPNYFSRVIFDEVSTRQRQRTLLCRLTPDSFLALSSRAVEPQQQPYVS